MNFKTLAMILLVVGIFFAGSGFYKLMSYSNPNSEESYFNAEEEAVNAYVGGDAYNYIINGTRATAYFVLAGGSFISALLLLVLQAQIDTQTTLRRRFDNDSKEESLPTVSKDSGHNLEA